MDIFGKTRELGEMIRSSKEMEEMQAAAAVQEADETAQSLMQEYNLKRTELIRKMQAKEITREEAVKQNTELFEQILEPNEVIMTYIEKQKQFESMINEVNQIINYYITGQEPGCTHDCCTCGGCH